MTTETGRTLMTINNLHKKCTDELRGEMIISKKDYEESGYNDSIKNYDSTALSSKKAIE